MPHRTALTFARASSQVLVLAIAGLACLGCFGNETTEFPPGLEPVAENTAPLPQGTNAQPYPQAIESVHGRIDGLMFGHSYAYIHASSSKVWAALKNPEVVADRRNTDRRTVTLNAEPEYEYSFEIHYEVDDIITVEWFENWRYGTLDGAREAPESAVIAFQKTFGTTFIPILRGSMSLELIEDGIVLVGMVEELDASMTEPDTISAYQADVFADIVATVNGQPLPEL